MNFISNLGRGFVRSAINQVGRDGGRVISNKVYGDAHAMPHRMVGGGAASGGVQDPSERVERCAPTSTVNACFFVLLGMVFTLIGGVALLVAGMSRMKRIGVVKGWRYVSVPCYSRDGRYRQGVRYEGDVLRRERIELEADEWEYEQNRKVARLYLYSGAALVALYFITFLYIYN